MRILFLSLSIVPCGADKFECKNHHWWKQCIDNKLRCDGHAECADQSDEINCRKSSSTSISLAQGYN